MTTLPPPPDAPTPPEPPDAGMRPTPLLIAAAIVAVIAVVIAGIVTLTGDDDDAAGPSPSGSTRPVPGTDPPTTDPPGTSPSATDPSASDPTGAGAPTSATTGEADDLEQAAASVQAMASADIDDCPIGEDLFTTISADAASRVISHAIEGGIVDVGVTPPDRSGASMVQCSAGSTDAAVGVFVGALGDLDVGTWLADHLGAEVELAAAPALGGEPAYTFEEKNELGRVVGASWAKDGFVATVAAFAADPDADLRPAGMRKALAGSLDTLVADLADAQPPDPVATTAPDTTHSTLPSETALDTSAALAGVERATRAGQDAAIECPIDPDTMTSFAHAIDGSFFTNALRGETVFAASIWLRESGRGGASAFRCTTSGDTGLVGVYVGNLGRMGLEGWLRTMIGRHRLDELGTNRGGTVAAVSGSTPDSRMVGSVWTDGTLVVLVIGVDDPARIDVTAVDTVPGLMTALQDIVDDLAQA